MRSLFILKNKNKKTAGIKTLFKQEDVYWKPNRVSTFSNNYWIEYESNSNRNKNILLK